MSGAVDLGKWRKGLADWLEDLARGLEPGRFRFCNAGSRVPTSDHAAQFATCFAMKAAWQAGIWEEWSPLRREACVAFVRSFQQADGWFVDPWLQHASRPSSLEWLRALAHAAMGRRPLSFLVDRPAMNLRSETRQSAGTLLMVGAEPAYELAFPWRDVDELMNFVRSLSWANPWSAGSHLSHVVFFLQAMPVARVRASEAGRMLDSIVAFLNEIRDPDSGAWFSGRPSDAEKLNGAMKVLTALEWLGRPWPDCSRLVAYAIRQKPELHGCAFLNRLHTIYLGLRGCPPGHCSAEVRQCAEDALHRISAFRRLDGGFSFYESRTQTSYCGASVSNGLPVSDLHGAAMMAWATAICVALLGLEANGENHVWRVHRA